MATKLTPMKLTPVQNSHVFIDEEGIPRLFPSHVKVRMLVESVKAYQCSPEELVTHFPHLKVAEVYAGMAYYYDHQAEIDEEIRQGHEFAKQLRLSTPELPITKRVRVIMDKRRAEQYEREGF